MGTYPLKTLPYKYLSYPEVTPKTVNVQGNTGAETAEVKPTSIVDVFNPNSKRVLNETSDAAPSIASFSP